MPAFDVAGARKAGYDDKEILSYVAGEENPDLIPGTDAEKIRLLLARNGKHMLDVEYLSPTQLEPMQEVQFQDWAKRNKVRLESGWNEDYDMRGLWKANPGAAPDERGQWPDTYKLPNHPTFSSQSIYALPELPAPKLPEGLSGPPASVTGSVPQTGERRNLTPQEADALWSEQGIQPTLPPTSLLDMAMLATSGPEQDAGIPLSMLAAVRNPAGKKASLPSLVRSVRGQWNWQPGAKLSEIPETVPIPRTDPKKLLVEDVARYLNAQVEKKLGSIPASASEKQKMDRLLKLGRPELEDQMAKPREQTGVDWYTLDTQKADEGLHSVFPELRTDVAKRDLQKAISSVMSNNSNPLQEALNGARIYEGYRRDGSIPLLQPSGKEWPAQGAGIQLRKIQGMIDALGEEGFVDFIRNPQKVKDIARFRPGVEGKANDVVPGSLVLGPKIGRYFMDIMGMPQEGSTIDKWDMRGQMRRMGRMFTPDGRMIEVPTPESERSIFMQQHKQLGDEYGLTRNGTQSALWHYEQDLYRRLGLPVKSYGRSQGINKYLGVDEP
jgi:hypothetical protein